MLEALFWVLIPLLVLTLLWWGVSTLRKRNAADVAAHVNAEGAREASARLNADQHRAIYRQLGSGNFLGAVQEYQRATGERSVKKCIIAVRSLEQFPQIHGPRDLMDAARETPGTPQGPAAEAEEPEFPTARPEAEHGAGPEAPAAGGTGAPDDRPVPKPGPRPGTDRSERGPERPDSAAPEQEQREPEQPKRDRPSGHGPAGELVIPSDWTEQFGSEADRRVATYKITEQVDGEAREFSTADLPPAEADQFQSMMRDRDYEGAAELFANFSGLTKEKIQPLLESAPAAQNGGIGDGVSDFGFEGEGPEGPVSFNSADLPPALRAEFLEHLGAGRLEEAGRIVVDFTGLPEPVVRQVLTSFQGGK
ncbi:hypothetical protein [Zhihengliuella sp.]|uniref:hypothetical protein n=1 Tax=Zhihengliuella sp. TaxID=1954483 RepID=UPI002811C3E2|nr:hypothetical protein [Zhihengliuella sp.]